MDTSAYAGLRSNHPAVTDELAKAVAIIMPVTVIGELEAGFRTGTRYRDNKQALTEFLDESFVSIFAATESTARLYGIIYSQLRSAGTPIPTNDMWIAACAMEKRAPLLTSDRHFQRINDLDVIFFET